MITLCDGNMLYDPATVLVIPTNGVGATGAGLAKQASNRWPSLDPAYRRACAQGQQTPGQLFFWQSPGLDERVICCFPTKRDWRDPSRLDDVIAGLVSLRAVLERTPVSVALPPLGCGLGKLHWRDVSCEIVRYLSEFEIHLYEPSR